MKDKIYSMKQLFVFIDTMIFLHYKAVEEINFPELFNVDKISILVPRITLRELDEQKNIHTQSKIRERAKKVADVNFWQIMNEHCPVCGCHLKLDMITGVKSCSFVKCKKYLR